MKDKTAVYVYGFSFVHFSFNYSNIANMEHMILIIAILCNHAVIGSSPVQCDEYLILDDAARNVDHGLEYSCDHSEIDTSPDWQGQAYSNTRYQTM